MLSHDLAHALLELPNYEVSYIDPDDEDELLPVNGCEEEGGEILLYCEDESEGTEAEEEDSNVIDVDFKAIA